MFFGLQSAFVVSLRLLLLVWLFQFQSTVLMQVPLVLSVSPFAFILRAESFRLVF